MRTVICVNCKGSFRIDTTKSGQPVLIPGVGRFTSVICEWCGHPLTVKVSSDPPSHQDLRSDSGNQASRTP